MELYIPDLLPTIPFKFQEKFFTYVKKHSGLVVARPTILLPRMTIYNTEQPKTEYLVRFSARIPNGLNCRYDAPIGHFMELSPFSKDDIPDFEARQGQFSLVAEEIIGDMRVLYPEVTITVNPDVEILDSPLLYT